MLVSLSTLDVDLSFSIKAVEEPGTGGVDGVLEPESVNGGLSVHIFSLSLSDSSPLAMLLVVCRLDMGTVKEDSASGLWILLSERNDGFGAASRLGLLNRNIRGLNSSVFDADDEEVDECRAKSDEEAGNDGRVAMVVWDRLGVFQDGGGGLKERCRGLWTSGKGKT